MLIPFSFLNQQGSSYPHKVDGSDGDLIVLSGQNVNIPEGSVKKYSSVRIDAGGTVTVTGNTGAITEIGCRGNFTLNGQIICRGYHNGGTFSKTSFFSETLLSHTVNQSAGGSGGSGQFRFVATAYLAIQTAGVQSNGQGGGGPGGFYTVGTSNTTYTQSGGNGGSNGGTGSSYGAGAVPGAGGTGAVIGADGANGQDAFVNPYPNGGGGGNGAGGGGGGNAIYDTTASRVGAGGGGGGGGSKGAHGKGLILYLEGPVSGSGTVLCSGANGFKGGNGGAGGRTSGLSALPYYMPARGGGGGAGGSGGACWIYYRNSVGPITFSVSVSGGTGGAAGSKGGLFAGTTSQESVSGANVNTWTEATAGNAGSNGSYTTIPLVE